VGQIELAMGVEHLRNCGFDVRLHEQCAAQSFTFAGTDEQRASAFYEYAKDPEIDVLWMGRGGYGAARLLPLLERMTVEQGSPNKKLLVGYSDVTALHAFVRQRWGWATLHAPMPAASNFSSLQPTEWLAIMDYVRTGSAAPIWSAKPLSYWGEMPTEGITGRLYGGNLTVWNCLTGTPFAPPHETGRILFFEDVDEAPYRLDRMVVQLMQSGGFAGVGAIVLGDFTGCDDSPGECLSADPRQHADAPKKPLRRKYSPEEAIAEIFQPVAMKLGIPVIYGLPVGHGPNYSPLPLGAKYRLHPNGRLELLEWDWHGAAAR
jgi:muramoyltetrapeptide carboxypeptidase